MTQLLTLSDATPQEVWFVGGTEGQVLTTMGRFPGLAGKALLVLQEPFFPVYLADLDLAQGIPVHWLHR